ncbi:MAG: hypothetical protein ABEJ31_11770 [Haloarculaceae archaeon]
MQGYRTVVEDGVVYVEGSERRVEVGPLDSVIDAVGGHAWTIHYADWEREYYDELDTSDEGLTVDVVDMMTAMTHARSFVDALAAHPADPPAEDAAALPPRLGLFVGKLLANLESGLD